MAGGLQRIIARLQLMDGHPIVQRSARGVGGVDQPSDAVDAAPEAQAAPRELRTYAVER